MAQRPALASEPVSTRLDASTQDIVIEIRGDKKWPGLGLAELFGYGQILQALVVREIRLRYAQTLVGVGWVLLQPCLTMLILTSVMGNFMRGSVGALPYDLFLCAGLLPWFYFAHVSTKSAYCLSTQVGILSRTYFPRLLLPIATAVGALVDLLISASILLALMVYHGIRPGAAIVFLPAFLILMIGTSLGLGLWLAVLNLYHRDVSNALPFVLQILFFCSPVVYPAGAISGVWNRFYRFNPLVGVLEGFRWTLFAGQPMPAPGSLLISMFTCVVVLAGGLCFFRFREPTFADVAGS